MSSVFNTYLFVLNTPGFVYLQITLLCKPPGTGNGKVGSPGQPADERAGYPKSIVTSVFSGSHLPACQQ